MSAAAGGMVRQAVFLVGGKGTRLGALTQATPKPLLEIAPGVRFLDVVLEEAARKGFTDLLLLAGHLGEQVEAAYAGRSFGAARVRVLREPEPMGTGGALGFAAAALDPWFVMGNGDSLFDINLRALAAPGEGFDGRVALREVPDPARYGAVRLEGARITAFLEKRADLPGPALINGGLYLLRREAALARIAGPCSIEADVFPALAAAGRLHGQRFEGYFLDMGLPDTYAQACAEIPARRVRPCAFLDRDGTLNRDEGYTHRVEDLEWLPGAVEAVRLLNDAGYRVIVVTNQAGVARGHYREADVQRFHAAMAQALAAHGAWIDAFHYCPHHPEAVLEHYRCADHPDRKPNPGMLLNAIREHAINPAASFLVGDQDSDVAAARAAGIEGVKISSPGGLLDVVRARVANG